MCQDPERQGSRETLQDTIIFNINLTLKWFVSNFQKTQSSLGVKTENVEK